MSIDHLRELLKAATDEQQHVVALFLDVRGFSSFAKIAESGDAAEFLKSIYLTILEQYLSNATFVKLTGDGMLAIIPFDRDSLIDTIRGTTDVSIRLVEDFPTMCENDPMVNFEVPTDLGVGLARGTVTCLRAGETVLDYSGRPLNLAARLMDLARPAGVVFDKTFGLELLEDSTRDRFVQEQVFVKGLAEDSSMTVYCLKDAVTIPAFNKSPMNRLTRKTAPADVLTFRELADRGRWRYPLPEEPARTDDLQIHVEYPAVRKDGRRMPDVSTLATWTPQHVIFKNRHYALIEHDEIVAYLKEKGVKGPWKVTVTPEYSVAADDTDDE